MKKENKKEESKKLEKEKEWKKRRVEETDKWIYSNTRLKEKSGRRRHHEIKREEKKKEKEKRKEERGKDKKIEKMWIIVIVRNSRKWKEILEKWVVG